MSVMTMKSEDFKALPSHLKDYANYMKVVRGKSEKTICEYLLDLRTFYRYTRMIDNDLDLTRDEFEKISIKDLSVEEITKRTLEALGI